MAAVELWTGLDASALTEAALTEYATVSDRGRLDGHPGATLWLTPTQRSQRNILHRLLTATGRTCFAPRVMTFDGFAEWLLQAADRPGTAISPIVRRLMLRRITQQLQTDLAFPHFGRVAETSGFLDVVAGFISELKRDEIWPEEFLAFARQDLGISARDTELGLIYQRYQDRLQQHHRYDTEGRFWLARTMLLEGNCRALPAWTLIAVVGFADFTPPQWEILEELSHRTNRLLVTLPGDVSDARADLFARCTATRRHLRSRWPALTERVVTLTPPQEAAFRNVLSAHLFGNPRLTPISTNAAGLSIIAATGPDSEVRAVARRIKALLSRGTAPSDVFIGIRSLRDEGERWRAACAAAGIPVWCEAGQAYQQQGIIKFLFAVLQAEVDNWSFPRLMTVLDSSYFRPPSRKEKLAAEVRALGLVLRSLRLSEDRMTMMAAVQRAASAKVAAHRIDEDSLEDPVDSLAKQAALALPLLQWYQQLTAPMRRVHTLAEWVDATVEFARDVGLEQVDPADRLWFDDWQRLLRDAASADMLLSSPPPELTVADLLLELRDLLANEVRDPPVEDAGCVRIVSMDQLRHGAVPHLFLVGLTEESFPRRRTDDCLFSEAERERFAQAGLPLRSAAQSQQDEAFFFWSLVQGGTQSLTLSYAAINPRGQPSFPSPYVIALQRLFTEETLPSIEEGRLDPVPEAEHALTATDVRLVAMDAARIGQPGWLRTLGENTGTRPMVENVLAAASMATARFHRRGFSAFEGRLEQPANLEWLRNRFGPQRQFSATEFEAYAACPFRFWMNAILDIQPLPTVEDGTDYRLRGVVVHDVLATLMPGCGGDTSQLASGFTQLVSEKLGRSPATTDLQRALIRIEEQLLSEWGAAYAGQFAEYDAVIREQWGGTWQMIRPEIPFGDVPGAQPSGPTAVAPALQFHDGHETVLVRGRIDRVDYANIDNRTVFNVIDYKTGRPPRFTEEDVRSGQAVQLMLYALAVKRLGLVAEDATPFQLGYWCLREKGFQTGLSRRGQSGMTALDAAVWNALEELLSRILPRLAAGIRNGEFVVDNADPLCTGRCPYRTVCRVNQVRPLTVLLEKRRKWSAPLEPQEEAT